MNTTTLYERLGGYDAIAAVVEALMVRIKDDDKLRRFYDHRGTDGIAREQQLLLDYLLIVNLKLCLCHVSSKCEKATPAGGRSARSNACSSSSPFRLTEIGA